jgi:hypothetical protein
VGQQFQTFSNVGNKLSARIVGYLKIVAENFLVHMINGYVHILVDYGLVRTLQLKNEERRGEGVGALKIFSFWTVSAVGCRTIH